MLFRSADLPFAQKRFCGAEGVENAETLSTFRGAFATDWGVRIVDGDLDDPLPVGVAELLEAEVALECLAEDGQPDVFAGDTDERPRRNDEGRNADVGTVMADERRLRQALFNLVGPSVRGQHAIDLFAGTGALGLEAISRGACSATFVEQHIPTARLVQQNITLLELNDICQVQEGNAFAWAKDLSQLPSGPWLVLCCPPYDFYVDRTNQMVALIDQFLQTAPVGSTIVVAFVLFGNLLAQSGGSRFFTDLSIALMGRHRGGSAKIERTANIKSVPTPCSRAAGNTVRRAPWCSM